MSFQVHQGRGGSVEDRHPSVLGFPELAGGGPGNPQRRVAAGDQFSNLVLIELREVLANGRVAQEAQLGPMLAHFVAHHIEQGPQSRAVALCMAVPHQNEVRTALTQERCEGTLEAPWGASHAVAELPSAPVQDDITVQEDESKTAGSQVEREDRLYTGFTEHRNWD